jgi:integrase
MPSLGAISRVLRAGWFMMGTFQNEHEPIACIATGDDVPEIEKLIGAREPLKDDRAGWRDRALIETMYSLGPRVGEAVALNWADIDRETGMLTVRQGKGDKARLIPVGEPAVYALDRWRPLAPA